MIEEGCILFSVVREAIKRVPAQLTKQKEGSILIWYDTLREEDHYATLRSDQIINRIPNSNLMCRKAPFIRLIHRMQVYYPDEYSFIPKSYILPYQKKAFMEAISKHDRKHIIKPDSGSLGVGIRVLEEHEDFELTDNHLTIAQEYTESYLLDNTKFDLRVFVLIASLKPLRVWIFRDGIARFCSEESSANNIYSQLTNTAVNKKNPNAKVENITKTIQETFEKMKNAGVDIDTLWKKIDRAIMLTIISAYNFMRNGEDSKCPSNTRYSRCFQILGFDVLIREDLEPIILEVNFRPSLATDTVAEREIKREMLSNALRIIMLYFLRGKIKSLETEEQQKQWLRQNRNLIKIKPNDSGVRFEEIYPTRGPYATLYKKMMDLANILPMEMNEALKMPCMVKKAKKEKKPEVKPKVPEENPRRKVVNTVNVQKKCVERLSNRVLVSETEQNVTTSSRKSSRASPTKVVSASAGPVPKTQKSPSQTQKSPSQTQKSPSQTQKSLSQTQKSPSQGRVTATIIRDRTGSRLMTPA